MAAALFGDPGRFALGYELREDPDSAGDAALRASWGALTIWVSGRCLTRGRTGEGQLLSDCEVPLLPVLRWLLENWDFLLHEERLPLAHKAPTSANWYVTSLRQLPRDESSLSAFLETRERWWARHALGAALPAFRVPDLHLRRYGESVELSWDDSEWKSVGTGVEMLEQPGAARVEVGQVSKPLHEWCRALLADLAKSEAVQQQAEELRALLTDLTSSERQEKRLRLSAGSEMLERAARRLRTLAGIGEGDWQETIRNLLGIRGDVGEGLYLSLPEPVLLYRSASPHLSASDLQKLLELCEGDSGGAQEKLHKFRERASCLGSPETITQDGYDRALDLREKLDLAADIPLLDHRDLESFVLPTLGVDVVSIHLDDGGVDGVALMGKDIAPKVAVNLAGRFSRTRCGRRMTLAHELCHLLHDGSAAGRVGIVSNPWASYPMERRANAFAAMLLAPEPAVEKVLSRDPDSWTARELREAMRRLGVGALTLTWHLHNLGWLTESERTYWLEELVG